MNIFDLQATISLNGDSFMQGVQQAQGAFQSLGSSVGVGAVAVGTVVGNMATKAASGLIDFGTEAVQTGMSFDSAMSNVQAISGATGEEFDSLRDKAKDMGASTKFTATEAAEAFSYMAMAGWDASSMLSGIEGIMNLAAASGESLATTSDIVTDALTAFGLSAEDSGHFADVLAAASSAANTNVSMMGETFKYVAPLAGTMGYSIEDMATAIGIMANSGIKGSQAGTALRSTITRLAKPTKEVTTAMNALGIKGGAITNADGSMKSFSETVDVLRDAFDGLSESDQAMYAGMMFGQEAMSGMLAIINASEADYNKLADTIGAASEAMDGMGTAAEMAQTQIDNLQGDVTIFQSAFDGLKTAIYDKFKGPLRDAVQTGTEMMSQLTNAVNNGGLSEAFAMIGSSISEFASEKFGQLTESLGPAGGALEGLAGTVQALAGAFQTAAASGIEGVSSAVESFVSAFDNVGGTGTIESITAAVSGLADAFASASAETIGGVAGAVSSFLDGFDGVGTEAIAQITKDAGDLFATFQTVSADLIGTISGNVREFLDVFPSKDIGAVIGGIAQNASELFGAFKMVAGTVIQEIASGIKVFFDGLPKEAIAATIGTLAQKIGELFGYFSGTIAGVVKAVAEAFSGFGAKIAEVWNTVGPDLTKTGEAISSWATLVSSNVGMVMSVLQPLVEYFGSVLSVAIQIAIDQIIATFGGLWNAVVAVFDGISEYGNAFVSLISGDLAGAAEHFKNVWEDIKDFFGGLKDALIEPFKSFARVLGDESNKGVEALKKPFEAVIEWFKDIGGRIVEGLKSGISAAWSGLTSWFTEKCDSLVGGVLDFFGIHSPSTVFAGIGKNLVSGMEVGWGREFGVLERQVEQDLDGLTDTVRMKFADSAIGRSSAAGISSNMALYGQRGGDSVEINLVLDGDVAARALYDPLRRAEAQKGMRKEAAYA